MAAIAGVSPPNDPIAAVTHPDPYPYYADLVARAPLYRDERLGLWIASSAAAVTAVLTSETCRVRPLAEPVPSAILGTPAAQIFRHLVRMNDGEHHCPFKSAVTSTLASIDDERADELGASSALSLGKHTVTARAFDDFAFALSAHVVGRLLGIPESRLSQTAVWVGDFVRCLAPGSSAEQVARGGAAAGHLIEMVGSLLESGLLAVLAREAKRFGRDATDVVVANGIGLMSQAYEATAGLIGNTLVTLAAHRELLTRVAADSSLLGAVVDEVARYDPSVQNTRRFLARDDSIGDASMKAGDAVLVVLAAANRDPRANPAPDRFDASRTDRRSFTFGAGPHACAGDRLAKSIARAGVARVIASGAELESFAHPVRYRPSVNTRIPVFAES
jgi:cytochrome P450